MNAEEKTDALHAALRDLLIEIGGRVAKLEAFREIVYKATGPTGEATAGRNENFEAALSRAREILIESATLPPVPEFSAETVAICAAEAIGE